MSLLFQHLAEEDTKPKIDLSKLITREQKEAIAAKEKQDTINVEARKYLSDTDWYVIRFHELGTDIPTDVATKRQQARESIV